MVKRRYRTEAIIGIVLGLIAALAIWTQAKPLIPHKPSYPVIPAVNAIHVPTWDYPSSASAATTASLGTVSIPVLSYHQMDNGCAPTAATCHAVDSVSQREFYTQMEWLHSHNYHTITAPEYVKWALGQKVTLPYRPVLLTVDDGIANFYGPATPVLEHFGYNAVSMIVSGFANRASDGVRGSKGVDFAGWDATWTQLQNLNPAVWSFAFHAGWSGHLALAGNANCPYFYPCQKAGETAPVYEARVSGDIERGIATEKHELGSRIDTQMWAVPFNDLAQSPNEPQSGAAPHKWLNQFATIHFKVVFVDGLTTTKNQHYRFEVHGTDSLNYFAHQVNRSPVFVRFPGRATAYAPAGGQS
jgi:hypothetical protein